MAYQYGIAVDRFQLLDKLRVFAESLGWVTDKVGAAVDGTDGYWFVHSPDGLGFWSFTCRTTNSTIGPMIEITNNSGFDDASGPYVQPGGGDYGARTNLWQEPYFSYDFFGTADYLHVVVQISAGRFRHFGIGQIENRAGYSDGYYAYGTLSSSQFPSANPSGAVEPAFSKLAFSSYAKTGANNDSYGCPELRSSHLRIDGRVHFFAFNVYQSVLGGFRPPVGQQAYGPGHGGLHTSDRSPEAMLVRLSRSLQSHKVNLVPFNLYCEFPDAGHRLVGNVYDMAVCRMGGIEARKSIDIGGEPWMVIPVIEYQETSATVTGAENSWDLAYAYRLEA